MERSYQLGFSTDNEAMFQVEARERKARTMVAVLADFLDGEELARMSLLNVGGSAGIIDNYLADHFGRVVGMDIDEEAVAHAKRSFSKEGLDFQVGDALDIHFDTGSFDVVVCSQVYEHVPDAGKMMDEILRVLRPGGVCYFAASNRLRWNEPHYNLPLLSVLPRPLAHLYIRATGKAPYYYEKHFSYWGLRSLVRRFELHDYTDRITRSPQRFFVDYMLPPGSAKTAIAAFITRYLKWLCPGYIWLLRKPG